MKTKLLLGNATPLYKGKAPLLTEPFALLEGPSGDLPLSLLLEKNFRESKCDQGCGCCGG